MSRLAMVLLLLLAAQAWAGPVEESKEHYDHAMSLYQAEHYEDALQEFHAAYALRQKPILLYNMAHCYRHLGQARIALDYYRRYYDLVPDLSEDMKAKVQGYMAQLRAGLEAPVGEHAETAEKERAVRDQAEKQRLAQEQAARERVEKERLARQQAARLETANPNATAALRVHPPGPGASRPIYRRWWFWTVVGIVAAGVVAGTVAGTYAQGPNYPNLRYPTY